MQVESLGWRSDLMIRRLGGSTIDDHADAVVVTTPANPTFHWANFILTKPPQGPGDVARLKEMWSAGFPVAGHFAIGIDGVDGRLGAIEAATLDAFPEHAVVLATNDVLTSRAISGSDEVILRPIDVDDAVEWESLMTMRLASVDDPAGYEAYAQLRHAEALSMIRRGHGAWWGAFVDGAVKAELGIFSDGDGVARYQHVGTDPSMRGRGVASALVAAAGAWAYDALPGVHTLVIIADPGTQAARLYRQVGFRDVEWQSQLYRITRLPVEVVQTEVS